VQTGAGKTHSMLGGAGAERGVIPRCVEHILASVEEMGRSGWAYTLEASCLEIYNEAIRDLLAEGGDGEERAPLQIRLTEGGGAAVADLTAVAVRTAGDIGRVMAAAERRRTVRGTDMNERSSRSHAVLQLAMVGVKGRQRLQGSLSLVDLAGSERLDRCGRARSRCVCACACTAITCMRACIHICACLHSLARVGEIS
jgi:kinesin family member C1